LYSYIRVLWFLSIAKTQISMTKISCLYSTKTEAEHGNLFIYLLFIYLFIYSRPCNMELIVNEKFEEIWKHAVIHNSGLILKFTWWCREKTENIYTLQHWQPFGFWNLKFFLGVHMIQCLCVLLFVVYSKLQSYYILRSLLPFLECIRDITLKTTLHQISRLHLFCLC